MTWVAVVMTPIVLVYQSWTYWVFRRRIARRTSRRRRSEWTTKVKAGI